MTRYTRQFSDLDGRGYGVRLETAPVHPGIAALGLQWASGRQHKRMMQQLDRLANIIIITRDYHGGRVGVNRDGQPVLHYEISPYDARHMMRGILEALRIQRAAGAMEIASPHHKRLIYRPSQNGEFSRFLARVEDAGIENNALPIFSAHQMSSCRIGGNSALGAISPEGESYEVKNLFVADGSALPTASGVNPMLTIMGVAHYLAQGIKAR
jgi:choline dehydrogenase-like flavoprotein